MKQWNQLLLHLRRQVDQQVAATQDVQLGERRIHDQILRRENDHFPNLFTDPVAMLFFCKEPAEPLRRDIGGHVLVEKSLPGFINRIPIQIGGENLNRELASGLHRLRRFLEHDGQGVGFLTGGAAGHPRPHGLAGRPTLKQRGEGLLAQLLPRGGITEKVGHADQ